MSIFLVLAHFSYWDPYRREKLAERAVLLLLALSMVLSPLDKAWHLFQRPNWFPFRYAFLFSFFLLYLAVQALPNVLDAVRKRWGIQAKQAAALLLTLMAVVEMGLNAKGLLASFQERYGSNLYSDYQSYYSANAELAEAARADAGDGFCRIGAVEDRGLNTPLSFGYPGITHYSSFYNYDVNCLLKALGLSQDWYWCFYHGSTPATDALLDVGYVISRAEIPGYQRTAESGGLALWKNPNRLPLAFFSGTADVVLEGGNPFERLNSLYSGLLGEDTALFTPVSVPMQADGQETVFTLTGTGRPVYAGLSFDGIQEIFVNGNRAAGLGNETSYVYCLGTPQEGEAWTVTVRHVPGWTGGLWEGELDALRAAVEAVDQAEIASVGGGRVTLTAKVDAERTLVTTIPAEKGWSAYVDGERAETGTWLGAFLSLELPAGEHTVELRYTAPGLVLGAVLGGVSVLGLILAACATGAKVRRRKCKKVQMNQS